MKRVEKKSQQVITERKKIKRSLQFGFRVHYVNLDDSCMNHYFPEFDSQGFVYGRYTGYALCVWCYFKEFK